MYQIFIDKIGESCQEDSAIAKLVHWDDGTETLYLRDLFATDEERWVTINGAHILIGSDEHKIITKANELREAIKFYEAHEKDKELRARVKTLLGGYRGMFQAWAAAAEALKGEKVTHGGLKKGVIKEMDDALNDYRKIKDLK